MSTPVGPSSSILVCPTCHSTISTKTVKQSTSRTHLMAFLCCICTCCLCAVCPYLCGCCKVTNHYCPNCNTFLGTYDH